MKDLSGIVRGTVHYKVFDVGTYGKDIHVGAAMILAKVSVFTPRPLEHYLNITKKNMVKVFRKDTMFMIMKEHKYLEALSEGLLWMVYAVEDFGVTHNHTLWSTLSKYYVPECIFQLKLHIAFYHTVSSEASSDRSGSRECFADAVFGAVVAMDELSGGLKTGIKLNVFLSEVAMGAQLNMYLALVPESSGYQSPCFVEWDATHQFKRLNTWTQSFQLANLAVTIRIPVNA
ncbi:GPCR kinase [Tanacetum coccineum]